MLWSRGLVGYWPLENTSLDASGNGNDGSILGGAGYGPGTIGHCIVLDGINDQIRITNNIDALDEASKFSFCSWLYNTDAGNAAFFSKIEESGTWDYQNDLLFACNGSTYFFQVNNAEDGTAILTGDQPINIRTHFAIVYDGTQTGNANRLKVYIDSILRTLNFGTWTVPTTTANMAGKTQVIGSYGPADGWAFLGSIDEVCIWNRALTKQDIKRIMLGLHPIS